MGVFFIFEKVERKEEREREREKWDERVSSLVMLITGRAWKADGLEK